MDTLSPLFRVVLRDGIPHWQHVSGRAFPLLAGGDGTDPPTGDPAPVDPPASDPPDGDPPKAYDEAYVKQLRAEAANYRKRATTAEGQIEAHAAAQRSETEQLKHERDTAAAAAQAADAKAQQRITRAVALSEASKLKFADPADAFALLDHDKIERDADGEPTNLVDLLGALAKAKPYLLVQASGPVASAANPARGAAAPADPKHLPQLSSFQWKT